ncbi:MAG: phosphate acetyltransferase, partial [Fibrobacteraceae bacterium]|nr:phosphate acetyltransferase [Fibrobacteraceae bacterium]
EAGDLVAEDFSELKGRVVLVCAKGDAFSSKELKSILASTRESRISQAAFRRNLIAQASKDIRRIVLPEGAEPRTVKAAIQAFERRIAIPVMLAKRSDVEAEAARQGLKVPPEMEIIEPTAELAEKYVPLLVELRKEKGMTPEKARETLKDPVFLGTMMLKKGEVAGLVSGAVHSTADTVRPALQVIKTAKGVSKISSVFFVCLPTQVLVFGDCAINLNPTAEDLAGIAMQSYDTAKAFSLPARVAMLSYGTGKSGKGDDVDLVIAATEMVRKTRPDIPVDGPLQYDAATVPSVAKLKAPESKIAGEATVLIFPDLSAGNICYKAVQRSAAGVICVGPMLQGLAKPVNDLSRGALVEDIIYTIALTSIQAQSIKD